MLVKCIQHNIECTMNNSSLSLKKTTHNNTILYFLWLVCLLNSFFFPPDREITALYNKKIELWQIFSMRYSYVVWFIWWNICLVSDLICINSQTCLKWQFATKELFVYWPQQHGKGRLNRKFKLWEILIYANYFF